MKQPNPQSSGSLVPGSEAALPARELEPEDLLTLLVAGVDEHAILTLDPEGHVPSWNAGAQRFKGYTAGEIIGRHFSVFYAPEDISAAKPASPPAMLQASGASTRASVSRGPPPAGRRRGARARAPARYVLTRGKASRCDLRTV